MTMVRDQELNEWIVKSTSFGDKEIKLKEGVPEEIKKKFNEWRRIRAEDDVLWEKAKNRRR